LEEIREKIKESVPPIFANTEYIINVDRLSLSKGQWHLIRIFKKIKEEFSQLGLLILGDGELKDYLVKFSQALELKTFVWDRDMLSENFDIYFLGFQNNPFKFMAKSRLFVFPSLWEGFFKCIG